MSKISGRSQAFLMVMMIGLVVSGCGGEDLSVSPDESVVDSDGGTTIRADIDGEGTMEFETDLGAFWSGTDQSYSGESSFGGLDVPFRCLDEVGVATITVTWVDEDVSVTTEVECVEA